MSVGTQFDEERNPDAVEAIIDTLLLAVGGMGRRSRQGHGETTATNIRWRRRPTTPPPLPTSASTETPSTAGAVQRVKDCLESAGVEFTNGDAPGVRLKAKG